jgi:hypothetical protein
VQTDHAFHPILGRVIVLVLDSREVTSLNYIGRKYKGLSAPNESVKCSVFLYLGFENASWLQ